MGIDIAQIADLGTQIAQSGAIRAAEIAGDEIFEYLVAIARLTSAVAPVSFG